MARGFVGLLQHSGEAFVNDRKVKGSGLDRDLSTVPTGSCNQWRISAQVLEVLTSCLETLRVPQNLCEKHHSAKLMANLQHCSLVYSIILSSLKNFSLFDLKKLMSE
ncbi:hypothetical protein AVEN_195275-1 [Araneus ventricosus]|uniref:Uncharacterized protein n=1 Tax=Araneus ventricosus TaxID=182803 RepID=A0A4Y2FYB2_ARAVE|nr:hypothetical protein AVEN_195275-1 [Araneus ventricosus]